MATKFRYYITDTFNGCIKGTNSKDIAGELALCEEFFVLDTETGEWITANEDLEAQRIAIEEYKPHEGETET